ncbi:MAG: ATP-dependent DNA helicase DinG [Alteromonadaceae bacterium]|jgi:ATP-dependent DNA helicase DinG
MTPVSIAFSEQGALAKAIDGFSAREPQIQMAQAVEKVIKSNQTLVVEAGTGTGKTYAYLVPALLADKKVVISTGTKNLQEQLFHRDLPKIKAALGSGKSTALLKGRANYLCLFRLNQHTMQVPSNDATLIADLNKVKHWAVETRHGDIGELTSVAEDSHVFPYITSTADNCIGKECPDFDDCHLVKARKRAMDADLVVVNHHLFFADLALKDIGFGQLMPEAGLVIFDEAHQVADIACDYFGESLSSRQLGELCRDIIVEYRSKLTDMKQLGRAAEKLQLDIADLRLCFPADSNRGNWRDVCTQPAVERVIGRLQTSLDFLYQVLKLAVSRTQMIDHCFERCVDIQQRLDRLTDISQSGFSYWYETTRRHVTLHLTPLTVADKFSKIIDEADCSWVFTSATLAVDDSFKHYTTTMGLSGSEQLILDSPFDYNEQAILCVPRYLPEPNAYAMSEALFKTSLELIKASKGRCFLLFTSHRMLRIVGEKLLGQINYPMLVQGTTSKRLLLEQFASLGNAVLLGTASFWEGVDVRGDALSCVLIDKLPFAAPDEPLLQARMEDCRLKGGDPFAQVQIPQAVISLKQGVGRLIRDRTDKGVLVICDNRLITRLYGKTFIKSLPPMKRTRDLKLACQFLQKL